MADSSGLPQRQHGVGDDLLERHSACPEGADACPSCLLHDAIPSASQRWRRAVHALVTALSLLLGAGGVAAQDTLPTVSVSDAEAYEDGRFVHFEVSLSQASGERVTVEVATSSGTARSGTDFRAVLQTVTFPAHSTDPQSVLVSLRNDRTPEPDETFTVTLRNPVGATLGDATATGTIRNDDSAATLAASGIGETSATLTLGGHTGGWWYKGGEYATGPLGYSGQAFRILWRNVHSCTAVAAGTTAVSIGGLTSARSHDYRAYSDSTCSTRLARVKFRTLAPEGTPTVSVSDAEVSEDGKWMEFTVSLSQASRERVTVDVRTSSGTATSGADFRRVSRTLVFPANDGTPLKVVVLVHDDEELEPDETFTVTLRNPRGATLGDATATGTIRDDGDTAATLTASDVEDTTATLTIAGHTGGWWYKGNAHACTAVAAGTTAVGIGGLTTVTDYEYTAFSDSGCGTRLARTKFKTLAPEGTPTVSISDAEVAEDGKWMEFHVSLSHPSRGRVTVEVHMSSGTATSWYDFVARPQTLTFHANSPRITRYARVEALDDEEPEPDETFTATLRVPVGATLGDARATGTILDDGDTAATLTASDIEDTTATLTVSGHTEGWWYTGRSTGTSSPWGACTAVAAGTTAVSVSGLTTVTDYEFTAYSDSTCRTKLARVEFQTLAPEGTPTVSISDAEAHEDGIWIDFKVTLSHPSRKRVFVRTNTSNGTATGGIDFAPGIDFRHEFPGMGVIFEANSPVTTWSRSVRVYDDQEPEPDETFTMTLSHPSNVTLGDATATGTIVDDGDTAAGLAASDIEDTTATLTISGHTGGWWYHEDAHSCTAVAAGTTAVGISGLTTLSNYDYTAYSDSTCRTKLARVEFQTLAPEGTPTVSVSDAAASEDYSSIRFNVSLSHPSREPVTVWYETSDGTATSGTDFEATSYRLTLLANSWNRGYTADVPLVDDQEPEPDETFTLTLTRATGATLGDATATGTIVDDGDTATTLTAGDIEDTTATLTIAGHTDGWWYKGNAHSCTAVAAGTTAVGIDSLTAVTDYEYSAYSDSTCSTRLASVAFRTLAAEGVTPTVSVSDAEVSEDGAWMQFWVSLSQPSREEVTVDVQTSDGTATSGTDYKAVSQTLTFPANSREPELVPVPVHDDQEPEPDETFTLTLTNPTNATLGDATATGTIRDDGDTAAMLAASDVEDTTATLTIAGHTDGWWYKGNAHACTAVAAGTTAVSIGGLTAVTDYEYTAFSDSGCGTRLARTKFKTLAPEGTPTVSISDAELSEDGGYMRFKVSLSQPSRVLVTVSFETSDGTAKGGTDFDPRGGGVLFYANSSDTTGHAIVRVHDDEEPEPDETFTVRLTNPVGATLGDATATGTIRDDGDTAATLAASDIEDTTATLTISGHTDGWWYKGNAHACTAVAVGTTAVSIGGLTTVTDYEYTAYSDSACSTRLARTKFKTLAPEGRPTVSISDAEVSEDGGYVTFAVSLSHPSRERVTVEVHTSSGTATSGFDFRAGPQTLTFRANSSRITRYARVEALDDEEPEPDETFTATLRVPVGATLGDATATGTIRDDGDTAARLTASDIEDTTATLTISGHTDAWWYRGGNAHLCTAVAAGTTAVSISGLTTVTDYEFTAYSDSACSTRLARVEFGTLAPEGTPTVSISDAEAYEDGTWIHFKVSLSHPSRKRVFVATESSDGTATGTHGDFAPGIDFKHQHNPRWGSGVIFEANSPGTTASVRVKVFDDQEPEPDETFTVTLTRASNATLGDATATGTIRDDGDTAARLTASDIEDTTATLTISGHTGGWWYEGNAHACTAVAAGTTAVSIGGLTTLRNYEFTAYSDSTCSTKLARFEFRTLAPEGTPTVSVSDAAASEDGGQVTFAVSLSHPSREPVTVWYETSGGTATSGTDFRATSDSLTLAANSWNPGYTANVPLLDDQQPEPDETFTLRLTRASGATLGDATATGTIRDDGDTAATLTASEIEDTTATLAVGGHTGGWWYQGNAHACTAVAAGTTAVGISGLTAVTDYEYSAYSDSTCSTKLARVAFRTLATEGVTPTVSVSDAEVSEDGAWMQFWVSLSQPSREEVTVDVQTSDGTATSGTDYKAVSQTLTFPANSREPELVPVPVHDDQEPELDETFTLTLTNPTNATLGDATATGMIIDDGDTAATGVAVVSEPGDDDTYAAGDTIRVRVTFGERVTVDTAQGAPRLKLDLGGAEGSGERWAVYASGSGEAALTFAYAVASGDESAAGIAVLADTLELNGGTITSAAGGEAALAHAGLDADPAHKVDTAAPAFSSAAVSGTSLTVTFDEALDEGSAPAGSAFTVTAAPAQGAARSIAGTGRAGVAGSAVTVTLAGAVAHGETLTVAWAPPEEGALRDLAGNAAAAFSGEAATNGTAAPVAVVSDPGEDDTYVAGDTIRVRVTFATAVTVDTAQGTPRLKLDLGGEEGVGERWAAYASGSGEAALTFAYAVASGDTSDGGVAVLADTLELNGGTIASMAAQADMALNHAGLDHDPAHKVDAVAPQLLRGEIDGGTMTLYFSEALDPDSTGGDFLMGVETPDRGVVGFRAMGGVTVDGATVTVGMGERMPRATAGLERNRVRYLRRADGSDGTLRDLAGNPLMAPHRSRLYTPNGTVELRVVEIDLVNITGGAPRVTGVAVVSDAGADRTYGNGDTIRVRVTFGEPVDVTGSPRLRIKMDPRWGEFWAAYESGGGTAALTFAYQVAEPNTAPSGIAVLANTLEFNGGTIRSGGANVNLAHTGLAHDADHKVDWRLQPESGSGEDPAGLGGNDGPPAVTGVSVVSSPASGDTYLLGETIRIRATFSEPVSVTGSPRLSIDMDPAHWGTKRASYESGGGTSSLDFVHTVVEPNYSTQGIAVLANSLTANGGTIRSAASQTDAELGHGGLGHASGHKVDWRPTISVADARADEGAGATVAFEVSLSRAFTTAAHSVTVDYATADGTAKAGEDYTSTSGTLTFAAGERTKTVHVPVLEDAHDEGEETFVLRLSNLSGARAGDLEATGTIVNSDPVPQAWLARFGRTVADQGVDAVRSRLSADRTPGFRGRIAGEALPDGTGTAKDAGAETAEAADAGSADDPMAIPEFTEDERRAFLALLAPATGDDGGDGADMPEGGAIAAKDLLSGTDFAISRRTDGGLSLGLWGRLARSGFAGREGDLTLDGEVTSAMLGTDWERRDALFGLMLFRSRGEGGYAGPEGGGSIEADLAGVVPWAGRRAEGSPTLWGAAGTGRGELTLVPEGLDPVTAGLGWSMAAAGAEGAPTMVAALGDATVRWRADALATRTDSDAAEGLAATSAETTRLRLGLEAAWTRTLASGATLSPRLEIGLRRDGGDAEAGFGLEAGGGLRFEDFGTGLSLSLDGRTLALHEDGDFEDWGVSVSLEWDPRPETRLGPSVIATRGWGGASSGGMAALLDPETFPGPAEAGEGAWSLEAAYGVRRGRGMTGSAYGRADGADGLDGLRVGWRVEPEVAGHAADVNADLWAEPERAGDGGSAVGAGLEWRW